MTNSSVAKLQSVVPISFEVTLLWGYSNCIPMPTSSASISSILVLTKRTKDHAIDKISTSLVESGLVKTRIGRTRQPFFRQAPRVDVQAPRADGQSPCADRQSLRADEVSSPKHVN